MACDLYYASVASLLHLDGTNGSTTFTDEKGKTWTRSGDAQISTAQSKFGGASALFDGTGDYLSANHADLNLLGASKWTVEMFVYINSLAASKTGLFYNGDPASNSNRIQVQVDTTGYVALYIEGGTGTGISIVTGAAAVSSGQWHHIVAQRDGTATSVYIDGVLAASGSYSSTLTGNQNAYIGLTRNAGVLLPMNGYIDDVRVTVGVARYAGSTIDVPSAAFEGTCTGYASAATALTVMVSTGDSSAPTALTMTASGTATAPTSLTVEASVGTATAPTALNVQAALGAAVAATELALSAAGAATAFTRLVMIGVGTATAPTALTLSWPSGRAQAATALTVTGSGSASASTVLAVIGTAHAPNWTARCIIDGVDVSAQLVGQASVTADEGAARIAQLTLLPPSGTIAPLDYVGKTISLDYVLIIGGVPVPRRLFTGRIDTPDYNPATTLLRLDCVDDLQNRVAALDRSVIDTLVGGKFSTAVQGEILDGWDYAQARLSTVAASLDAGASGGMRVTPWQGVGAWATWGADDLLYQRPRVTYPQRSTLVNRVDIEFDYRYPRLRQRYTTLGWSGTNLDMAPNGWQYPTQQDILGAAGGSGWQVTLGTFWPAPASVPHSSGGFIIPAEGSIDMAVLHMTQRHRQTVTESYALTVTAPESVAANGELARALRGALSSEFDGLAWESALDVPPLIPGGGEMDWAPDAPRADADYAIETLLDQANVRILGSHRSARVVNAVLCNPELDLDKRIAISTAEMNAAGKVASIIHMLDFDAGSAVSEFAIACFGAGGAGIITPDTLAPPDAPDEAAETQSWPGEVPPLWVNTYGVTPYSETLVGLLLNPPETISVENVPGVGNQSFPNPFYVAGSYPVTGFRVTMPGVDDADRNPIDKPVAESYAVAITPDPISFTIP
jgi:hypothetical protein